MVSQATVDKPIRDRLRAYLADIKSLHNESAKTHRFAQLISELFPDTNAPVEFVQGVETRVRINMGDREKNGRIDAYYGNAVIEFENSLAATGAHAEDQLREYTAGQWAKRLRPLVCIASDGITWRVYHPRLRAGVKGKPKPVDAELEKIREIVLRDDDQVLHEFWIWITSVLFRPARAEPTTERFAFDFSIESPAFADAREALERAWKRVGSQKEPQTAFDTWRRYLTVTYGTLDSKAGAHLEALFLKHSYLASVARLLIWAALSKGKTGTKTLRDVARSVLSGEYFRAERRIDNLVEDDFFQWVRRPQAQEILAPVWERTIDQLLTYDLDSLNQDIFKGVYQQLVDPEDRHDLGEYYTPDWLCERIITEMLPKEGFPSVLDPTCGSGSFLRAAIAHVLAANPDGGDATRLRKVLDSIVGIDIHPLAVTIAKATYLLAVRDLVKATNRPIQVPVYLADSLFLPAEVSQLSLIGHGLPTYEIRFGKNKRVAIPEELVRAPELFDPAVTACAAVAVDHAKNGDETLPTLRAYLKKEVSSLFQSPRVGAMVDALWEFTRELADLIKREENSIWAFVVRNAYRPAMLRDRFDFLVGNPPWLSYRYISDPEYQAEVSRRAVDQYRIAPKSQKLRTQMELATVVLVHTLSTFGKNGAQLAFVMPRSVLSADQHENLRLRKYVGPINIHGYWDLFDVAPIFNVPCCVLFARKEPVSGKVAAYRPDAVEWSGTLKRRDMTWTEVEPRLKTKSGKAQVIWLGSRTALSTKKGRAQRTDPSKYMPRFRQGATLVPRNLYFVSASLPAKVDPDGLYHAETEPEQAKEAKEPYKGVVMSGDVEGRFFFATALSKHLLPFALVDPPKLVLPVEMVGGRLEMRTSKQLKGAGHRRFATWMATAENIWNEKREDKASKQDVYERLDYQEELTIQDLSVRYMVVYNAAGTNLAAAVVDRSHIPLPFVVEHKLYHCSVDSADEGYYLSAILNAETVNEEIKPFQSSGLLGERDIEKKVLELPIPIYDQKQPLHLELSKLGRQAAKEVLLVLAKGGLPVRLGNRRTAVREAIAETLAKINDVVSKLL